MFIDFRFVLDCVLSFSGLLLITNLLNFIVMNKAVLLSSISVIVTILVQGIAHLNGDRTGRSQVVKHMNY